MDDLISRQAVLDVIEREMFIGDAISEIEKLPSVTPKQKMGRWIKVTNGRGGHECGDEWLTKYCYDCWEVLCSECGARKRIGWTNIHYCPMCGTRMEGEE